MTFICDPSVPQSNQKKKKTHAHDTNTSTPHLSAPSSIATQSSLAVLTPSPSCPLHCSSTSRSSKSRSRTFCPPRRPPPPSSPPSHHFAVGMQRTTFVAQPAHFSMSAMRRILSPVAVPTDNIPRVDSLQANSVMFMPSSSSTSSPSVASQPQWSARRRRGSISQATSQQVISTAVSSPLSVPNMSASAPSTMTYPSDTYDTHEDESDDDYDDELDDEDASDDLAMWTTIPERQRSGPIAIPNAEGGRHSRAMYAATPVLPDPRPIVTSYLIRHAPGRGGLSSEDSRTESYLRRNGDWRQRSPFAPEVPFGEVLPGKPDTGDSISRRMAYFDEDALY